MTRYRELAATILGIFEDYLSENEFRIENPERDEAEKSGEENLAILYGQDYYDLEDRLVEAIEVSDNEIRGQNNSTGE